MLHYSFNEIGGNFWLNPSQWDKRNEIIPDLTFIDEQKDVFFTSSGRGAISLALKQEKIIGRKALLPMFTCESVIKPFLDNGFQTAYYEIEQDLTVNVDKLGKLISEYKPSVLFLQTYFGFDTLAAIRSFIPQFKKENKITIIEDITHSWLSVFNKQGADYYVASLRKWLELPDGGVIISTNEIIDIDKSLNNEDDEIVDLFEIASAFKHEYTETMNSELKPKFRKRFYHIENILDSQDRITKISAISKYLLANTNFEVVKKVRRENYLTLLTEMTNIKLVQPCFKELLDGDTPLYFCVLVNGNREDLQKQLAMENIYAPVLWPVPQSLKGLESLSSISLYKNLLCFPCDQRYNKTDMLRIVFVLKSNL